MIQRDPDAKEPKDSIAKAAARYQLDQLRSRIAKLPGADQARLDALAAERDVQGRSPR